MPTVLTLALRLASEVARGNLVDIRRRAMRSLLLAAAALVLIIVALGLAGAGLAVVLAERIGTAPALLSIAAVAAILAMILMLVIGLSGRAPQTAKLDLRDLAGSRPKVDPLVLVIGALSVGLLVGRRKG